MTTMAKIIAGGQPGAAVGGRADIMELMAFPRRPRVGQRSAGYPRAAPTMPSPLLPSAGIAALEAIANEDVNARADAMAERLKDGLNDSIHTE